MDKQHQGAAVTEGMLRCTTQLRAKTLLDTHVNLENVPANVWA